MIGGGAGYYYQNHYNRATLKSTSFLSEEYEMSHFFQDYIKKNKLTIPEHYKTYLQHSKGESFFHQAILQQLNGLGIYNILLDTDYHDIINSKTTVTKEEKKLAHSKAKVYCLFTATDKVQGHLGIIHGGFTATLFDNVAGILAHCVHDLSPSATAYLNIQYKKPLQVGKEYVLKMEVKSIDGKKAYLDGIIMDKDEKVYAEAESLFIRVNWGDYLVPKAIKDLFKKRKDGNDTVEIKKEMPVQ